MNDLVTVKRNDVFTDSMVIAQGTGVEHRKIKAAIRKNQKHLEEFGGLSAPHQAENNVGRGRPETYYLLNEQQATFLITLLKNTEVVVGFKKELVKQFYKMRNILLQKQTSDWVETRRAGKLTRKSETDVIKELTQYAAEQGSANSEKLYMVYSKLANRTVGVSDRELATILQINNLSLAEGIILHCIKQGMAEGKHYKEIYQDSKARLELFKDIALIEAN
jgi:phage regulator Rha-like protein